MKKTYSFMLGLNLLACAGFVNAQESVGADVVSSMEDKAIAQAAKKALLSAKTRKAIDNLVIVYCTQVASHLTKQEKERAHGLFVRLHELVDAVARNEEKSVEAQAREAAIIMDLFAEFAGLLEAMSQVTRETTVEVQENKTVKALLNKEVIQLIDHAARAFTA